MKTTFRSLVVAAFALMAIAGVALAIQPGTTGTEKRFQQQGLRIGVPVMVNNTATAVAANFGLTSTATLNNAGAGVITSDALTTTAGTEWSLTLTNNLIAATDLVFATVGNGTNTTRSPGITEVTPAAGSVTIRVRNGHAAIAFNGTLKIGFVVIKQSVLDAD